MVFMDKFKMIKSRIMRWNSPWKTIEFRIVYISGKEMWSRYPLQNGYGIMVLYQSKLDTFVGEIYNYK